LYVGPVQRGDIVIFRQNAEEAEGSEQRGTRPGLVIQNDVGNCYSGTTIVALMTKATNQKPNIPTHQFIKADAGCWNNTLTEDSIILFEQIKTIDKKRIIRLAGKITPSQMNECDEKLLISIGIGKESMKRILSNIE
jgi:mRNA interferase MazF